MQRSDINKEEAFLHLRLTENTGNQLEKSVHCRESHSITEVLEGERHQSGKRQSDVRSLLTCHGPWTLLSSLSLKIPLKSRNIKGSSGEATEVG